MNRQGGVSHERISQGNYEHIQACRDRLRIPESMELVNRWAQRPGEWPEGQAPDSSQRARGRRSSVEAAGASNPECFDRRSVEPVPCCRVG
jgi:hypothetical protein